MFVYFTYRPSEGSKRPTGTKEGERSVEKPTESSSEMIV